MVCVPPPDQGAASRANHERAVCGGEAPLYTGAALLVLPWLGFLLNTWLGAAIGIVLYVASRMYAPAEEVELAQTFGGAWDAYTAEVKLPWL